MIKILIVDDHEIVRKGLKSILSEEDDLEVLIEASNAKEAFELLEKVQVDVVILDISMPGMSGYEALKKLKELYKSLPIIMISALSEDAYATKSLKAGAQGFVSKESAPEELVDAIRKVVTGRVSINLNLAERIFLDLASDSNSKDYSSLTEREFQILLFMGAGKPLDEIALSQHLSKSTINTYRSNLLKKLKLRNNLEIINYCIRENLIE